MIILINTFIIKSCRELIFKNKIKMLKLPIKAPIINLYKGIFLRSNTETLNNSIKSKKKLRIKIKSKYTFIASPIKVYKKTRVFRVVLYIKILFFLKMME